MPVKLTSRLWLALRVVVCLLWVQSGWGEEPLSIDLGFLEYLGGLVEEEGEWVGPEQMEELMVAEQTQQSDEDTTDESEVTP